MTCRRFVVRAGNESQSAAERVARGSSKSSGAALSATAWRFRTGAPWRDLPDRFGNWNTIYKNFDRWSKDLAARSTAVTSSGNGTGIAGVAVWRFRPTDRALPPMGPRDAQPSEPSWRSCPIESV
jgi:hypothetical protein